MCNPKMACSQTFGPTIECSGTTSTEMAVKTFSLEMHRCFRPPDLGIDCQPNPAKQNDATSLPKHGHKRDTYVTSC